VHIVPLLVAVLPWLRQGAALTPTQFDDMAVDVFEAAIKNDVIAAWLESLFHADPEQRMTLALAASHEVEAAFAERKIDWKTLLPKVLKLVALFA
jgi:hypothetical protein